MKLETITAMSSNILICLQARKFKMIITMSLSMKICLQVMVVVVMMMNIIKTWRQMLKMTSLQRRALLTLLVTKLSGQSWTLFLTS